MRAAIAVGAASLALLAPAGAQASQTLTIDKAGSGASISSVTSSPSAISCGATCSASFPEGETITLTASPGPNTEAVKWSGCDSLTIEKKCKVSMSSARSVSATFDLVKRKLSVSKTGTGTGTVISSPAGIECGPTCSAEYDHGTEVTLTGSLGPNTAALEWSGCDSVLAGKCKVSMTSAKAVSATFKAGYGLAVSTAGQGSGSVTSSPSGINCGSTCQATFLEGTAVTLTATPGLHSKAATWSGCDSVASGKCKVTASSAKAVTATFELQSGFTLEAVTIEESGNGQGTVTSSPAGIDCGSDCEGAYVTDTALTLSATPSPGSAFKRWSRGCSGTAPTCQKTIKGPLAVKALFIAVGTRALSVTKSGTGQGTVTSKDAAIACGNSCSADYGTEAEAILTATPSAGSTFAGWSGACAGTARCRVRMNEARQVTASFSAPPTQGGGGEDLGGKRGAAVIAANAKLKGGKALLRALCNGPEPCKGTISLFLGKARVGSAPFSMAPGTSKTLAISLSPKAKAILAKEGHLKLRAKGSGVHPHNVSVKPKAS